MIPSGHKQQELEQVVEKLYLPLHLAEIFYSKKHKILDHNHKKMHYCIQ